jgi:RNA polymerase sigma-70 factor (ECF subfamily)
MTDTEFETVMRRQIDHVLRLACSYLKCLAEAEDAAQEVFLKLYRTKISFESPKDERAWLLTVTSNICKNRLRSPWFSRRADTEHLPEITEDFPEEEKTALAEVMALPEKYRIPIHLFYCEEYSVKEISKITGIKESTVRTRLQRGRELLRIAIPERKD